jgi:hypothetical protein
MASTLGVVDLTSALRPLGSGVPAHGRALGPSTRQLVVPPGIDEPSRVARGAQMSPTQLLGRMMATPWRARRHCSASVPGTPPPTRRRPITSSSTGP